MRLRLQLETETGLLKVPIHYNQLLQGLVYHHLSRSLADRVHTQGFRHEKRQFRMFTFSGLVGRTRLRRNANGANELEFTGPVSFWLASPETDILESFASHIVREGRLRLGDAECHTTAVEVPLTDIPSNQDTPYQLATRTLSPITVYSTLLTGDGRKKTYYYSPQEREFNEQMAANLVKKQAALFGGVHNSSHSSDSISLAPVRVSTKDQHIVMFKNTVTKTWSGIYELTGLPDLLRFAFDCGLGACHGTGNGTGHGSGPGTRPGFLFDFRLDTCRIWTYPHACGRNSWHVHR